MTDTDYADCSAQWTTDLASYNSDAQVGDTCLITIQNSETHLIEYTEMWGYTGENESQKDCVNGLVYGWRNLGPIKGDPGKDGLTSYIHQRFANVSENGTLVPYLGEKLAFTPAIDGYTIGKIPGKYQGMYPDFTSDDSENILDYKWVKWSGDDGFGMEQIFIKSANKPIRPTTQNVNKITIRGTEYVVTGSDTENYYTYDAVPTVTVNGTSYSWSDKPMDPDENGDVWVSVRKLDNAVLKDWSDPVIFTLFTEDGKKGDGFEEAFFALTADEFKNRTMFIAGDKNLIYVYDDITHDGKTFEDNYYMPYIKLDSGSRFGTISSPGITEARPYVFRSTRCTVNGEWVKTYDLPNGSKSSFSPAALCDSGNEIDYTYADVNFDEDSTPVLVNSINKQPINNSVAKLFNYVDFYHGNERLIYKKAEIKVNGSWQEFITWSKGDGIHNYTMTVTPVTINNITLTDAGSITTNSGLQWLNVRLIFNGSYVFDSELSIPVRLTSFESYIDSNGATTYYSAEGSLNFIPITTNFTLKVSADGIIQKTSAETTDYTSSADMIFIFREGLSDKSIDIGFTGVTSFPTTYSNWKVKVLFDNVETYTFNIGNIYNNWRTNHWNNNDDGISLSTWYNPAGEEISTYRGTPVSMNVYKTFTSDQQSIQESEQHYVHDLFYLILDVKSLPVLTNSIKFVLYDGETLIDEETIPIIYSGKNGVNGRTEEHVGYITSESELPVTEWPQESNSDEVEETEEETETNGNRMLKSPTRGGEQTQTPEIEIGPEGNITITGGDGTITIDDGSGVQDQIDISTATVYRYELVKVTEYDENNNATITVKARLISTSNIPSYYLIKDRYYYGEDENDPIAHPQNKKIYALVVDNGSLSVMLVKDENSEE